jgi:hypothetical protein
MANAVSPVIKGLEPFEQVLAKDQKEYSPLPILRGRGPNYIVMSRWTFTAEERAAIAAGSDLIIAQMTFGQLFQPTMIEHIVAETMTEEQLEHAIEELGIRDELDERLTKVFLDNNHPFG